MFKSTDILKFCSTGTCNSENNSSYQSDSKLLQIFPRDGVTVIPRVTVAFLLLCSYDVHRMNG